MKRVTIKERPDWREKASEFGFYFHSMHGKAYWSEEAYYQFTLAQIEELENTTAQLHEMCLEAVEKVVNSEERLTQFCIPRHCWDFVKASWDTRQPSLYSRLDLAYDGQSPAKLLENNADTPTSLYETAFFQWLWLEDQIQAQHLSREADQYNSLQEKLIYRFAELKSQHGFTFLHFTACQDSEEDRATVQYLKDCAKEADLEGRFLFIDEIGLGEKGELTDTDDQVIQHLFKLYPWEFMFREMFSTKLEGAHVSWLEPAWKSLISNKALLPLLWEMYPHHPNLLPAYFLNDPAINLSSYVVKPLFSREGANIEIVKKGEKIARSAGPYGAEGKIVQQFHPLPRFGDSYTVIGSWLVNDQPCGIGLREDNELITQDLSRFYPHIILN
ncbi:MULTISPECIES: glutathionylspermidine synthase family protein [Candidatus Williamhamiltonella]|uniref:Glutathionylspermidine synthase pre-ATP-grasp-like domain-containing protein n=1 Tax=Candidatus Williamhamiltonella defendens TaxID=138072 RepID=A0A2D3TF30_9ENTR|nr:glutathionylspermidine synthase family protein [Candidatus Hamiltonella defensa]ATW34430.1 hypothetical protein BJP43_09370 [Candidatus Hamiltonella defensa]